MIELLERWAEMEPERCTKVELINDGYGRFVRFGKYVDMPPEWTTSIVQGDVQQAIEARGWDWKMHSVDFRDGKPRTCFATALYPRGEMSLRSITRQATSPTEALLTAYLAALEVNTEEEINE